MLGRGQKAQIRKEALRLERVRMRRHIADLQRRLKDLLGALRRHHQLTKKRKRELLEARRKMLVASRKLSKARRAKELAYLNQLRADYRKWVINKRIEQAQLLDRVHAHLDELQALSKWEKEQMPIVVARIEQHTHNALQELEQQAKHTEAQMIAAIEAARREIHGERYDLSAYSENRRLEKVKQKVASRVVRRDLDAEVESNLLTAEQLAYWHHERESVLRAARRLGRAAPDEIAEIVRESAEFNEDKAIEFLDSDVAAWVKAETKRVQANSEEYPF